VKIFGHVQIKVKDLKISRKFYDEIMLILGYKVVLEIKDVVIGYGMSVHNMFKVRQFDENSPLSHSVHLAFNAPSRESVNAFHLKALKAVAICNGKPGLRPEYEDGYYAAFVIDPDGHNIEAVYQSVH